MNFPDSFPDYPLKAANDRLPLANRRTKAIGPAYCTVPCGLTLRSSNAQRTAFCAFTRRLSIAAQSHNRVAAVGLRVLRSGRKRTRMSFWPVAARLDGE